MAHDVMLVSCQSGSLQAGALRLVQCLRFTGIIPVWHFFGLILSGIGMWYGKWHGTLLISWGAIHFDFRCCVVE